MTVNKVLIYIALALYMVTLGSVSLITQPLPEDLVPGWQGVYNSYLHIPAYAVLTYLWIRYLGLGSDDRKQVLFSVAVIAMAYGILMEYLKIYTPDRFPSLMNVGLNAVGVGIVVVVAGMNKSQITMTKQ